MRFLADAEVVGDAGDWTDPTVDELIAALRAQATWVKGRLNGQVSHVEEVLEAALEDAVKKIDLYRAMEPRPDLGAWVCGFVKVEVHEFLRRGRPKASGMMTGKRTVDLLAPIGFDDMPFGAIEVARPATPEPHVLSPEDQARIEALHTVERFVGHHGWRRVTARIQRNDPNDQTAQALRSEIQQAVDALTQCQRHVTIGPNLRKAARRKAAE